MSQEIHESIEFSNIQTVVTNGLEVQLDEVERGVYANVPTDEDDVWIQPIIDPSLPEFNGLIDVPKRNTHGILAKILAYVGPGAMISVGYMDPGNWSTDLAGGSAFGYNLLFIILLSSFMAMFLQYLSLKAGLATARDLAQICRDSYHPYVVAMLWIVMEVAIAATDVAEVIIIIYSILRLNSLHVPIFY